MKCYRTNCKEECNSLKVKYCLFKITAKQKDLIAEIRQGDSIYCSNCPGELVQGLYKGNDILLCTSCGIALKGSEVVRKCLVNSRIA